MSEQPPTWGPSPYYPPPTPRSGGLSSWAQVLLGALIGGVCGVVVLVLVLILIAGVGGNYDSSLSGEAVFALCVLVPTLLPVPLLFFRVTRMWAVGLVIGAGLSTIALAGSCALILTGLEGSP